MKLIIGLGNPGEKYKATRHNIGFMTVDEWAWQHQQEFNKALFEAVFFEQRVGDERVFFLKPQTFMNLSGNAVRPFMKYFNISIEDIAVIYDDMDLPVGTVRFRQQGGSGGHNGIKSMITNLDTKQFNRIRLGVGRPKEHQSVTSHVLGRFDRQEEEAVISSVKRAVEAIDYWIQEKDFIKVMNRFNASK